MALHTPYALQHVNLVVPSGSLPAAQEFYGEVIGFANDPVPANLTNRLLWFRVGDGPQQVHVASPEVDASATAANPANPNPTSSRHPCFSLASPEALLALQKRIFEHRVRGGKAAALECDRPGEENSGSKGVEFPTRFFARDFAGNRLEFAVHPR